MSNLQITIDDGPAPVRTALTPILAELARRRVAAAFFVLGEEVVVNHGAIGDIHRAGHVLGNHSWNHLEPSAASYTDAQIRSQFDDTQAEVLRAANVTMAHWRAPRRDSVERLGRILTGGANPLYRLSHNDWHGDSGDTQGTTTAEGMLANIRAGLALFPNVRSPRLLFHVVAHTAAALPTVLERLIQEDGHTLVNFTQAT
jgi:peptidoglycan/xylan/chitin deacetylase (PgdA/CDA1 family)